MAGDFLTDEEIEAELVRLALRGRGRQLQPRVAALRAILKSRQVKRAARGEQSAGETAGDFAEMDLLSDMAHAIGMDVSPREWHEGSVRVRGLVRDGREILQAADRAAAIQRWRAGRLPPEPQVT